MYQEENALLPFDVRQIPSLEVWYLHNYDRCA